MCHRCTSGYFIIQLLLLLIIVTTVNDGHVLVDSSINFISTDKNVKIYISACDATKAVLLTLNFFQFWFSEL